jgi:HlyD family secretion protein
MVSVDASPLTSATAQRKDGSAGKRWRVLLLLVGILTLGGVTAWRLRASPEQVFTGTVESRTVRVGSRFGGRVQEVLVREGEMVKAGQALIRLEPGDLLARKRQAEGELAAQAAFLAKLENGSRPQEIAQARARAATATAALRQVMAGSRSERIAAAQARVRAAEARLEQRRNDVERAKRLLTLNAITQQEAELAETAERAAAAELEEERKSLEELERGARPEEIAQAAAVAREAQEGVKLIEGGAREEDLAAARAQLEIARGKLDAINAMIEELTIKAPSAARVESLTLRPGEILGPDHPAVTLLEEDQLYVRFYIPETRLGRIKVGQTVSFKVDSFPDRSFDAVVEYVSQIGEFTPRNLQTPDDRADHLFAARASLRQGRSELHAGMAALVVER